MATLSITKKFTNPTGHIVANAQEIAYEEGTGGSGALIYDRTVVSVKDKIDALLQSINTNTASIGTINSTLEGIQSTLSNLDLNATNVVYSEGVSVAQKIAEIISTVSGLNATTLIYGDNVSVKDKIDEINTTLNGLNPTQIANSVTSAQNAANQAISANNNLTNGYYVYENGTIAATYNAEIQKYTSDGTTTGYQVINGKLNNVDVIFVKGTATLASEYSQKFDEVLSIADELHQSFDADAQFQVITNAEYKNKLNNNQLVAGTIYFCYDGTAAAEDLLYDVTLIGTGTTGTVQLTAGSSTVSVNSVTNQQIKSLSYNTTLNLVITPNSDYQVSSIMVNNVAQNISTRTLKVTADTMIMVYFAAIPKYTATFDINGTTTTAQYAEGDTITYPEVTPAEGYTFTGWDPEMTIMPAHDQTFTAQFTENTL